jgi:hypothetical protein
MSLSWSIKVLNNFLAWLEATGPAVAISECSQASNSRRFSADLRSEPQTQQQ